jgi:mannose-6-phosphate isomerase-like protein (cupin superfamily)
MQRIRIDRHRIRREPPWHEVLPPDPRDPDVVRAKALARARDRVGGRTARQLPFPACRDGGLTCRCQVDHQVSTPRKYTYAMQEIARNGGMEMVNLDLMLARFSERWSPKTIAQVNDYAVRIVLGGQLTIQMRDRDVVLGPRELFVVPRGVEHCPRADTETAVLLFEPDSVVNTGDAGGELTAEDEWLA